MKVGTVVQLKVACLGNQPGAIGVVFNEYKGGFQVIFENGEYDGFSTYFDRPQAGVTEADHFLSPVGFSKRCALYKFDNVIMLADHFRKGWFDCVLQNRQFEVGNLP